MNLRRLAVSLLLLGIVTAAGLRAGDTQSSYVPGDLGPAAEKLGVALEVEGYYDLGRLLSAIVERLPEPESADEAAGLRDLLGALETRLKETERQVGLMTEHLTSAETRVAVLEERDAVLRGVVATLTSSMASAREDIASLTDASSLKVAFVNVDSAFQVFLNAVSDLRQGSADKTQEINDLQASYRRGATSLEEYQRLLNQYNAELLDANVMLYAGVLDRMIASASFADLRTDLQTVRASIQSLLDESKTLVSIVTAGSFSQSEFQLRLAQAQNYYSQIEKVVNQACAVKISQAAQKVAILSGFDLVLIQKNVLLYFSSAAVTDITSAVKTEIAGYL